MLVRRHCTEHRPRVGSFQMLFVFCLLLSQSTYPPSGGPLSENQAGYDLKSVALTLDIDIEAKSIAGHADLEILVTDPGLGVIELDLHRGFAIREVRLDGRVTPYKRVEDKLFIGTPNRTSDRLALRIAYAGKPREARTPPWDGGFNWTRTDQGRPWVGVSCQFTGGMVWFPCKTDLSDRIEGLELNITVPADLYCAANGNLEKIEPAGEGKRSFHWKSRYPIADYNVSINIAPYRLHQRTWRDVPLVFYALDSYQAADRVEGDPRTYAQKCEGLLDDLVAYLDFMHETFAPYPWPDEKLGIAHTAYLGMEHQTINAYGNHFKREEAGIDRLLLHELAHEWWGNKLGVPDWRDMWLQEGFATYTEYLYAETVSTEGAAEILSQLKSMAHFTDSKALVREQDAYASSYAGDIYNRGAMVLHSLRYLLGDEVFGKVIKRFAARNGFVTTEDFTADAEAVSKKELAWFFDVYCHRPGIPVLTVTESEDAVDFRWDDPSFAMPVEIEIGEPDRTRTLRAEFSNGRFRMEKTPGIVWRLDPEDRVLKKIAGDVAR